MGLNLKEKAHNERLAILGCFFSLLFFLKENENTVHFI